MRVVALLLLLPSLAGCVRTVGAIVTAPVRVVGAGVDAVTTSEEEADRNRGREMREAEERARRAQREQD